MKKTTLIPADEKQFQEWTDKLDEAGAEYQVHTFRKQKVIWMNETDAEVVLGIEQVNKKPKMKPVHILVGLLVAFFLVVVSAGLYMESQAGETAASEPMSQEQLTNHFHKEFGRWTSWETEYIKYLKKDMVKYPRTFEVEAVQIYPIDADSLVHVFKFSAENAFGVRTDHSVSTVVSKEGNILRTVNME